MSGVTRLYEQSAFPIFQKCGGFCRPHPQPDRRPILSRVAILGIGGIVVGHLANVVPDRYDPMTQKFWARILVRRAVAAAAHE